MRIHLPLHPHHFAPQPLAGPSSSPIVQLGGELVILELQGELSWEGEKSGGVVGVLGLDRPDKPTLHLGEHHLLHGKMATLPRPYAVIRRVVGTPDQALGGEAVEGDAEAEQYDDEDHDEAIVEDSSSARKRSRLEKVEEDEEEPPLFALDPDIFPTTPKGRHPPSSSSPIYPPSTIRDYSSELDFSSPAIGVEEEDEDEEIDTAENRDLPRQPVVAKRKRRNIGEERERTRHYEVVGVVRKKVVFALRPEPIVTATVLPD